jgi:hypothetical protein
MTQELVPQAPADLKLCSADIITLLKAVVLQAAAAAAASTASLSAAATCQAVPPLHTTTADARRCDNAQCTLYAHFTLKQFMCMHAVTCCMSMHATALLFTVYLPCL